ncbi:MAG: 23S rRNA pseudouridylate synthase B [Gammaproteobacteria bacterium CG11_big_fil_rev_8_21_14_0_20_46_22]|nr:MAG: 23S rRNA pseudouridylate synthase B [Gammaproteobacteria bacterium CG12_big_fil_rev_8_21_14_0_65_46_12]PIR12158.1 MAG: 23S rRNA pseudouridylate synthase B [Gammaproteobacteria bacterium CG11_big_fil_rev_8_21_14_0_20_46_22]
MKKPLQKPEKIQKILASRGIGSRRQIEQMIIDGKIRVNGKAATLGDRASSCDRFEVNGQLVKLDADEAPAQLIMYHKPAGEICTRSDPQGRPTVFHALPKLHRGRWINVGRLDLNTSGLLLFTDSGELANQLMHPGANIEREYAVRVFGEVDDACLSRLLKGVELEDGLAKFERVSLAGGKGKNQWFNVVLTRGKNREVRRLWESQGLTVSRLIRIRFGSLHLPRGLKPGRWQSVSLDLLDGLRGSL